MATIGETYGPAMTITGQPEADRYFEELVRDAMERWGKSREETERNERANLGYYAGYYDETTRARVERLYRCAHPIFGAVAQNGTPAPETALNIGAAIGRAMRAGD